MIHNIASQNILGGKVTNLIVADLNEEGKVTEKLSCEVTDSKVQYLFRLENEGNKLDVSAGVLRGYLIKQGNTEKEAQKIIDRAYNVGYASRKGKTASKRITADEKAAAVEEFLNN